MFHHIPALKFEPSPGANNPEEFLLYNVRNVHCGESSSRPADVLLPHWDAGRDGALDVTVIHPFQAATVAQAA